MQFQLLPEHRERLARLLPLIALAVLLAALVAQFIMTVRRHNAEMRLYRDLAEAARSGRTSVIFNAAHFNANVEHGKPAIRTIPADPGAGRTDGTKVE